jgi:TPR repeat protein
LPIRHLLLILLTVVPFFGAAPARSADIESALRAFEEGDYATVRRDAEPLAKAGDPSAQFILGLLYERGYDGPPDELQAAYWYRKAADQGLGQAEDALKALRQSGRGFTIDNGGLLITFGDAYEGDRPEAQLALADAYYHGNGVSGNKPAAAYWYGRAAGHGLIAAKSRLGRMLFSGDGIAKDETKAVGLLREAADRGDAEAAYGLGIAYATGRGIERDDGEAVRWFRSAAEAGNDRAAFNLARMTEDGRGTRKDQAAALDWYRRAADAGNSRAELALGLGYAEGIGSLHEDDKEAVRWFQKAADQGEPMAAYRLGLAYDHGYGVLANGVQAARWYEKAAEGGVVDAMYRLGILYANGDGVTLDLARSYFWYSLAAAEQHKHAGAAAQRVAQRLSRGDLQRAREQVQAWLAAANAGSSAAESDVGGTVDTVPAAGSSGLP